MAGPTSWSSARSWKRSKMDKLIKSVTLVSVDGKPVSFEKRRKLTDHDQKQLATNREIVAKLSRLVEKYPGWRFHQLLMNVGIEEPGQDKWHEESEATMVKLNLDTYGPM